MALDGDEVDDDDDRDMLLLSLLLRWNAALQRVHAICRSSECMCGLWKPVAAMACGRWLWKACGCNGLWPLVVESLSNWGHVAPRTSILRHCKC